MKMEKRLKWLLLGLAVAFAALVVIPLIVGAITQPDALAGLQEYFKFLISLAEKRIGGIQGVFEGFSVKSLALCKRQRLLPFFLSIATKQFPPGRIGQERKKGIDKDE